MGLCASFYGNCARVHLHRYWAGAHHLRRRNRQAALQVFGQGYHHLTGGLADYHLPQPHSVSCHSQVVRR